MIFRTICKSYTVIFLFCSRFRKAIEKASENQKIVEALGTPIVRGPWYDSSLAVGHRRNWVSCTFPVSGPQGSGRFQMKAFRLGGLFLLFTINLSLSFFDF